MYLTIAATKIWLFADPTLPSPLGGNGQRCQFNSKILLLRWTGCVSTLFLYSRSTRGSYVFLTFADISAFAKFVPSGIDGGRSRTHMPAIQPHRTKRVPSSRFVCVCLLTEIINFMSSWGICKLEIRRRRNKWEMSSFFCYTWTIV